jgi:hypothetical protein
LLTFAKNKEAIGGIIERTCFELANDSALSCLAFLVQIDADISQEVGFAASYFHPLANHRSVTSMLGRFAEYRNPNH